VLRGDQITDREKQVLILVARGATDERIAREMKISAATVRSHLQNIRAKLGYTSCTHKEAGAARVRLAMYAVEVGILPINLPQNSSISQ